MKRQPGNAHVSPNRALKSPTASDRKKQSPQTRSPNSFKQSVTKQLSSQKITLSRNKENQPMQQQPPSKEPSLVLLDRLSEKSSRLEGSKSSIASKVHEQQRLSRVIQESSRDIQEGSRITNTPYSQVSGLMETGRASQLSTIFPHEVSRLPPEEDVQPVDRLDDEPVNGMRSTGRSSLFILGLIPIVLLVGFMVAEQMNLSDKVRTSPLSVNYTVSEEAQDLFSREQLQMQAEIIVKTIKQELSQCGSLSVNTYQKELLAFYHDNHPETLWMILLELINDDPHLETTFDQQSLQEVWVLRSIPI